MAGLFDRLQNELDDRDKEGGITALDLADLPAPLRKLMRLMLRKIELDTPSLRQAVDAMPEKDRDVDVWPVGAPDSDATRFAVPHGERRGIQHEPALRGFPRPATAHDGCATRDGGGQTMSP